MRDRLRLNRGVDHHPFEIPGRQRPGLVRDRQALLEQGDQLLFAQPLAPMRQRRAVERQPVAEAQFAAEELVIRVPQPARTEHLVRQVVHVIQDEQPRHQPGRQRRLPHTRCAYAGKTAVEKLPIDLPRQPHQRVPQVDDVLERRPQQILLTIVPWLCHRVPPTPMTRHRIAQITENRNPKSPETRAQTCHFRQNRSLQNGRSPAPLNGLAVLHGRLSTAPATRRLPRP